MRATNLMFRVSILSALGLSACADRAIGNETLPTACEDPQPIVQAGTSEPSGFVQCADGFIHRSEPVACLPPAQSGNCSNPEVGYGCATDADCTEGVHGVCNASFELGCYCDYSCETDADCGEGKVCACAGVVGSRPECIPASCAESDACEEGLCGLELWEDVCGVGRGSMGCTSEASTCRFETDCGTTCATSQPVRCMAELGWQCQSVDTVWCDDYCGTGRPFVIDHEHQLAAIEARADWCASDGWVDRREAPALRDLALAEHWTRAALYEHASVASFARFGLQLLALGAPPRLLRETQRAMDDEIVHAQLAFALASRFAGRPVGPGPLAIAGALDDGGDLRAIVRGLVREACVGETLAAIEAHHAAARARDRQVRAALERIAADELRHAELGWSSLRWILDGAGAELRRFALACLDAALREAGQVGLDGDPEVRGLEGCGLMDMGDRLALRRDALDAVLRPCVAALRGQCSNVRMRECANS